MFGARLRTARKRAGLTHQQVTEIVAAIGVTVSRQAVGAWEAGEYAPDSYGVVDTLEKALECKGELLSALGYSASIVDELSARLAELERRSASYTFPQADVDAYAEQVHRLEERIDGLDALMAEVLARLEAVVAASVPPEPSGPTRAPRAPRSERIG